LGGSYGDPFLVDPDRLSVMRLLAVIDKIDLDQPGLDLRRGLKEKSAALIVISGIVAPESAGRGNNPNFLGKIVSTERQIIDG